MTRGRTLRRLVSRSLGSDVFISYRHSESQGYAARLQELLEERGLLVFRDESDEDFGTAVSSFPRRACAARTLVVIVTPEVYRSQSVYDEVAAYLTSRVDKWFRRPWSRIIPINVGQALSLAPAQPAAWSRLAAFVYANEDREAFATGTPSAQVVERVARASFFLRSWVAFWLLTAFLTVAAVAGLGLASLYLKRTITRLATATAANAGLKSHNRDLNRQNDGLGARVNALGTTVTSLGSLRDKLTTRVDALNRQAGELETRVADLNQLARRRALVVRSMASAGSNPEMSVLYAEQAVDPGSSGSQAVLPEGERQLHRALWQSNVRMAVPGPLQGVSRVAWDHTGARLVAAGLDGSARIYDALSGKALALLPHRDAVRAAAWSPNDARLATAARDGVVKLWSADGKVATACLDEYPDPASSLAWSPDSRLLAVGREDGSVEIRDGANGLEIQVLGSHQGLRVSFPAAVLSVSFSPDGTRLAVARRSGEAEVWNIATGQVSPHLGREVDASVLAIAWNADGRWLATGTSDGAARIWDAASGGLMRSLPQANGMVYDVAWNPESDAVALAGDDGAVRIYHLTDASDVQVLAGARQPVYAVAWDTHGERLATVGEDGVTRIWDVGRGSELATLHGSDIAWSPDGRRAVTTSGGNIAEVWDTASWTGVPAVKEPAGAPLSAVVWCAVGGCLQGIAGGRLTAWDAVTGAKLRSIDLGGEVPDLKVFWSPDRKRLVTLHAIDNAPRLLDAATGREVHVLHFGSEVAENAAWSQDGSRVAIVGGGEWQGGVGGHGTSDVFDASTGKKVKTGPETRDHDVGVVALSRDGTQAATDGDTNAADIWQVASGIVLRRLPWDADSGDVPGQPADSSDRSLSAIAWSPDDRWVATGADDGKVKLWDSASQEHLDLDLGSEVTKLVWSADSKRLAAVTKAGRIEVLAIDLKQLSDLARRRVTVPPPRR